MAELNLRPGGLNYASLSADEHAELMTGIDLSSQVVVDTARRVAAETERWCKDAAERGPGWRVWRSYMRTENDVRGYRAVHDFQLLPPGAPPPGSGMVFGPWDATPNGERDAAL